MTFEDVLNQFEKETDGCETRLAAIASTPMTLENCRALTQQVYDARQNLIACWVRMRAFIKYTGVKLELVSQCEDEILRLTEGHPHETQYWTAVVGR